MSDGFPLGSCVDAILSRGGVVEAGDRLPASVPVFCRGRRTVEGQTHWTQGPRVLWTMMKVGQWIVEPRPDGGRSG